MALDDKVRSAIRAETDQIPAWAPDLVTIRRAARIRTRRRATLTAFVTTLAAVAVTGLFDALPRVDTAPAVDESQDKPEALALLGEDEAVPPGRYRVEIIGLDPAESWAEFDVPRGFRTVDGSYDRQTYVTPSRNRGTREPVGIAVWRVTGVNPDPCDGDPLPAFQVYRDPGPTVTDMAEALVEQPYRQGDPPRPTTLAGYDGLYLELRFPEGFHPGACATGTYEAWVSVDPRNRGRAQRFLYEPLSVDRIWVLDVDGTTVVVNAYLGDRGPENLRTALDRMLDSLEITVGDG